MDAKKAKQQIAIIIAICTALVVGAFKKESDNLTHQDPNNIVIRFSHVASEDTSIHQSLLKFKELLEERSGGRFDVRVYPNSQLGGDRQNVESCMLGYVTGAYPSTGSLANFEPGFMIMDLPFLFKNREDAFSSLDGELGDQLNEYLLNMGIYCLGYGETGYRYITTNDRPIRKPEDLKGLKIRTMENPMHIASFRAWGASPTPMNFAELFTGLQQGAVDAQENPLQIIVSSRFYEVQNTLSLTGHFYSAGSIILNNDFVESLSEEDQRLIKEVGKETVVYERELSAQKEAEYLEEVKKIGMEVVELTDDEKQAFIDQAISVYTKFEKENIEGKNLLELVRSQGR